MFHLRNGLENSAMSLDHGIGAILIRIVLSLGIVVLVFGGYGVMRFRGLTQPRAMESAQLAANMAAGKGYVTSCVRPLDVALLEHKGKHKLALQGCPDVHNPPLFPFLISLGLRAMKPPVQAQRGYICPAECRVIVPLSALFAAATAALLLWFGVRHFNVLTGVVAAIVYCLTDSVLEMSISGSNSALQCLLVTACVFSAFEYVAVNSGEYAERRAIPELILLTILLALAVMTEYSLLAMVLPLALVISGASRRKWLGATILVTGTVLMILPWALRNIAHGTGPFGLAHWTLLKGTVAYPLDELDRSLAPSLNRLVAVRMIKHKFFANIGLIGSGGFAAMGAGLVSCLFTTSLLFPLRDERMNRLRWCVTAGAGLQIAVVALKGREFFPDLHIFLPLLTLFAMEFAIGLIRQHEDIREGWQPIVLGLIIFLCALPSITRLGGMPPETPYPPYYPPMITHVSHMLAEDEVLCTDIPWATAWYGGRTSVLLPEDPASIDELGTITDRIGAIYLTTRTADRPYNSALINGFDSGWLPLIEGHVPQTWVFTNAIALPYGTRDQIFITDRVRWERPDQSVDNDEEEDQDPGS